MVDSISSQFDRHGIIRLGNLRRAELGLLSTIILTPGWPRGCSCDEPAGTSSSSRRRIWDIRLWRTSTVRFGDDPKTSALDANCKAHELDNLYVVDGSFFPSSAAVNPALTIMANALRVGDRIAERLG